MTMHPKSLYLHSSGAAVRALQLLLRRYEPDLPVDGSFGRKTERAVRVAQRKLEVFCVDGIAGSHTLATLAKAAKAAAGSTRAASSTTGAGLEVMARRAGASAMQLGREALDTAEEALRAVETWIGGLHHGAAHVPPALHLVVPPAKAKAKRDPMPPGQIADPKSMSQSEKGRQFVFRHEAGDGHKTAHLHHSPGHSGVTLGPGYDMRARTADDITADLVAIGIDPKTAAAAAKGAGLHDEAADQFVKNNRSLLNLSTADQIQLQITYRGRYEQMVRSAINVPLH